VKWLSLKRYDVAVKGLFHFTLPGLGRDQHRPIS
jgi:hypothetical protein